MDHGQIGVLLGDASRLGQAWLDRELYLPKEWTNDPARWQPTGIPADRRVATTPPRAQHRRQRALAAGVPGRWGTGDRGDGHDRWLRLWWEAQPWASVLAVSGQADVGRGWQPRPVNTLLAALPEDSWTRVRAGDGAKGLRGYDGQWRLLADPVDPPWRRWLLVRRSTSATQEMTASVVFAPQATALAEGCGSPAAAGRWRAAAKPRRATSAWIMTRSGVGRGGIGISPSCSGPTRF
jgi:hypothetical protein